MHVNCANFLSFYHISQEAGTANLFWGSQPSALRKRSRLFLLQQLCSCILELCLTAHAKSWQFADTLLLCSPPQLLRCIDPQFVVQMHGDMRANMLDSHQCTSTHWQSLYIEVMVERHRAGLDQLCNTCM